MKSYKILNQYDNSIEYYICKRPIRFDKDVGMFVEGEEKPIVDLSPILHNENGPAVVFTKTGHTEYWWNGEMLYVCDQEEFENWKRFRNFR